MWWWHVWLSGAVGVGLAGCGARRPPELPLPPVVTLYVAVSDQAGENDTGSISAMVETIEAKLRDGGYTVSIVPARSDEPAPLPRVELQVRTSDPADQEALAGARLISTVGAPMGVVGVAILANGDFEVDAFFVEGRTAQATHLGRYNTSAFLAITEDAQTVAGERAGNQIARRLLRPRGESWPNAKR